MQLVRNHSFDEYLHADCHKAKELTCDQCEALNRNLHSQTAALPLPLRYAYGLPESAFLPRGYASTFIEVH